ncbi:MAG: hypothetical protein QGF59_07575 [Pirellulaceae bacterium]|nr:hypothetical protein [Pirellulaceae bacterium]
MAVNIGGGPAMPSMFDYLHASDFCEAAGLGMYAIGVRQEQTHWSSSVICVGTEGIYIVTQNDRGASETRYVYHADDVVDVWHRYSGVPLNVSPGFDALCKSSQLIAVLALKVNDSGDVPTVTVGRPICATRGSLTLQAEGGSRPSWLGYTPITR